MSRSLARLYIECGLRRSWPYGTPLYGQMLEVLDDATHDSLPAWTVGPIYIGGVGVALGYRLDPALTHRQFVRRKRPPGDKLFRTGDLGRLRPDDNGSWLVEILGREDSQVKLRGNRVELGEVDAALASLPGVLAAASVIRDEILVAFVVMNSGRPERLTSLLAANLPKYMVPARIISIDSLPLSSNGKVLREKLPPLAEEARDSRQLTLPVEARNDMERRILAAFARHLKGNRICCETTDFFQAGGSSLSGIRLVAELNEEFGGRLSPRDLLKSPTVAGLAVALAEPYKPDEADSIYQALPLCTRGTDALLVLLNPAGASGLCYVPLAAALADSFLVVALDDGVVSGRSSELPFNTISAAAQHAAQLVLLLRRKYEAQVFLLGGWSYGGVLALEMAKIIHDVDGLVLLDAPVFGAVVDGRQSQHDEPRANRHFIDATELLRKYYQGGKHGKFALKCPLLNLWPRDSPTSLNKNKEEISTLTHANTTLDYLPADHWTMLDERCASVAATRIRNWFTAEFVAAAAGPSKGRS